MIPGMRRLPGIAAFLLVAALGAGCTSSGGTDPASPPPSSPLPSTSAAVSSPPPTDPESTPPTTSRPPASPTVPADVPTTGPNLRSKNERPPVEPIAALKHTQAGANAFARFFILTIDWAYATVEQRPIMSHYSDPRCPSCQSLLASFRSDRRAKHTYVGGRTNRVVRVRIARAPDTSRCSLNATSFEELDKHGDFVIRRRGVSGSPSTSFDLRWTDSGWRVVALEVVQ